MINRYSILGRAALDRRLAAGERADGDRRLARRAETLTGADSRRGLARTLLAIIGAAERRPKPASRAPIARREVTEAADELRQLAARLESGEPVDPRGVAEAHLLITDGSGPLYNRHSGEALATTARAARVALA
jgi:hypothetical protein